MSARVTLFLQANVHGEENKASVWLLPGTPDPDKSLEEESAAIRVVGPVLAHTAGEVIHGLEKALTALGFSVLREVTADD